MAILLRMAFNTGYEAVADVGSGELLAEAQALQIAFYDLDGKTRRAIVLDDMAIAAILTTAEREEDCACRLCQAIEAV
ncbi:MAG: hypothetical protein ACLP9L_10155 [Thermoguttaceae bacterium]